MLDFEYPPSTVVMGIMGKLSVIVAAAVATVSTAHLGAAAGKCTYSVLPNKISNSTHRKALLRIIRR